MKENLRIKFYCRSFDLRLSILVNAVVKAQ